MRILKIAAFAIVFISISFASNAQQKIAHINSNDIIQQMSEYKIADMVIDSLQKAKQEEINTYNLELQKKQSEYIALNKNTTSEATLKLREKELTDMDQRIKAFIEDAKTEIQNKQAELFEPIQKKLQKAIEAVAKEKGYAYVMDDQALLVKPDADDISPAVKVKLGIVTQAPTPVPTPTPMPTPTPKK